MVDPEIVGGPTDDCRFGWFEGIVTGPRPGDPELHALRRSLNEIGLGEFELSTDGGRFLVLPPDGTLIGARMTYGRLQLLVDVLQQFVAALPPSGDVESSLRFTEVFADESRETLVQSDAGTLHALSRVRDVGDNDLRREPATVRALERPRMGWSRLLLVLAMSVVAFSLAAWHGGWVDRVLSSEAATLEVQPGDFRTLVSARIEPKWGNYAIEIRRGPAYPSTSADVEALLAAATTAADRAAVNAVADGNEVFVRLESIDGTVLAVSSSALRPLLSDADAVVRVMLPGRIEAARVRLALDDGRDTE